MEDKLLTKEELLKWCNYCLEEGECAKDCPANGIDDCGPFLRKSVLKVIEEQDKTIAENKKYIEELEAANKKKFETITIQQEIIAEQGKIITKQEIDGRQNRKTIRDKAYMAGKVDALKYALVATLEKAVPKGYTFK